MKTNKEPKKKQIFKAILGRIFKNRTIENWKSKRLKVQKSNQVQRLYYDITNNIITSSFKLQINKINL